MYTREQVARPDRADCSIYSAWGCTCSGVIGNQKSEITQWFPISDLRLARSVEKCKNGAISDFLLWNWNGNCNCGLVQPTESIFYFSITFYTLQIENQKIEAIFWFSIPNDKWKSENWTYFLIFIFKLKMKNGNHWVISDFLFQIRKGNLNCGIVHGPARSLLMHTWARLIGLRNLHTKRCERHERREETGEKSKFSALYTPSPGFQAILSKCLFLYVFIVTYFSHHGQYMN